MKGLFAAALVCLGASAAADESIRVVLLHTNDVHGQAQPRRAFWKGGEDPPLAGGLPRVAAYVRAVRAETEASGAGLLVVDAGDWFQGTPEGLIESGRGFARAVAAVGYDALCVGNHELDHGLEPLKRMLSDYRLPAVCANVYVVEDGGRGQRADWVAPWRVFDVAGVRVGVVGLLTPVTPSISHPDAKTLWFENPARALHRARDALAGDVDWVLPVTHLGIEGDRELARAHSDLPLIVGGHSHTFLAEGERVGTTLVAQVGSKASAVGRADLWFERGTLRLLRLEYQVVELEREPAAEWRNAEVDEICAHLVEFSEREMGTVVGTLSGPLPRSRGRFSSSPAGNLITDALLAAMEGDVAIQNRGGIRADLDAGPVTRRELFELLPFGNHLARLTVSGEVLRAVVRAAVEGTAHTGLEFSGMVVEVRVDGEGRGTLARILVHGEPLEPEREYRLVTNDFLADGGDGYLALAGIEERDEKPQLLREMLEQHFRRAGEVTPPVEERYRVLER